MLILGSMQIGRKLIFDDLLGIARKRFNSYRDSYKDVIDAADAIGSMKQNAELLLSTFDRTDQLLQVQDKAIVKAETKADVKKSTDLMFYT